MAGAESYVQLPQDSVGKKLRTNKQTKEGVLVEEQVVRLECHQKAELPAYAAIVVGATPTANQTWLNLYNAVGSNKWVELIFAKVAAHATAATAGYHIMFRLLRHTTQGSGTTVTPVKFDTANADLPSQIAVLSATGSPAGSVMLTGSLNTEETGGHVETVLFDERITQQPLLLREGEGCCIAQAVAEAGAGLIDVMVIFRVRPKET